MSIEAARTRALIVCTGGLDERGGQGRVVRYFTRAWAGRTDRAEVEIVDTTGDKRGLGALPAFARALVTVVTRAATGRVDLLHIHMAAYGSMLRKSMILLLGRCLGVPGIIHVHAADLVEFYRGLNGVGQWLVRFCLRQAARIVVLGSYWRDFLTKEVGLDPQKVLVVPNGVPGGNASRDVPARIDSAVHPVRLLFLGQLIARKGLPDLLAALCDPRLAGTEWELMVAGDGEQREANECDARARGVSCRVTFRGWQTEDQVGVLLRTADVLVLPSYNEGLPLVILEAMAHGVAVVSTRVGSTADAVIDGETGFLVEPGDVEGLVGALDRLIRDPELRSRFGAAAATRFAAQFTLARFEERIHELYESVVRTPVLS